MPRGGRRRRGRGGLRNRNDAGPNPPIHPPAGRQGPSHRGRHDNRSRPYDFHLRQQGGPHRDPAAPPSNQGAPALRGWGGRCFRSQPRITSAPRDMVPEQPEDSSQNDLAEVQDDGAGSSSPASSHSASSVTSSSFSPPSHASTRPSSSSSSSPSTPYPPSPPCHYPLARARPLPRHGSVCEACAIITSASSRLYRQLLAGLGRDRALLDRWADEIGIGDGSTIEEMEWRPEATTYVVAAERSVGEMRRLVLEAEAEAAGTTAAAAPTIDGAGAAVGNEAGLEAETGVKTRAMAATSGVKEGSVPKTGPPPPSNALTHYRIAPPPGAVVPAITASSSSPSLPAGRSGYASTITEPSSVMATSSALPVRSPLSHEGQKSNPLVANVGDAAPGHIE